MPVLGGRFSSDAVFGGSYFGMLWEGFVAEVTVVPAAAKAAIETPIPSSTSVISGGDPCIDTAVAAVSPRVELGVLTYSGGGFNTGTAFTPSFVIGDVTSISVTLNSDKARSIWNITTANPHLWSPLVTGFVAGDKTKAARIFFNWSNAFGADNVPVITGMITVNDVDLPKESGDVGMSGVDLSEALRTTGSSPLVDSGSEVTSGTATSIVGSMIRQSGLGMGGMGSFLSGLIIQYLDYFPSTMQATIDAITKADPSLDWYVDENGLFSAFKPDLSTPPAFTYDGRKNATKITYSERSDQIVTVVSVVGGGAPPVTLTYEDAPLKAIYGRRVGGIDSFVLATSGAATLAAKSLVARSLRDSKRVTVEAPLNVHLRPRMVVTVIDTTQASGGKGSGLGSRLMVVRTVTHSWNRESNRSGTTSFSGELLN